jgi:pimeloyl-ACP methyl ester carboxylesterase
MSQPIVRPFALLSEPFACPRRLLDRCAPHTRQSRINNGIVKLVLRVFAWMSLVPYAIIAWLVLSGIASWSAVFYVVATGVLLGGLATLPISAPSARSARASAGPRVATDTPKRRRRPRGISRIGAAAIVLVALLRTCTGSEGRSLRVTGADGASSRLVDRVVDESDLALAGTRALFAVGMLKDDAHEAPEAMRAAYTRFRAEQGDAPSPAPATFLGLERPSAFDIVVFDPPAGAPNAHAALVFLHGFGGGFDLPCWQLARAVGDLGVSTLCPSTGWLGDWSSEAGEATLRRTLAFARARGATRIVLAGLSNGGIGASVLAPRLSGELAGLVLVSGAEPSAASPGIPTLVLHGRSDSMTSADDARAYATRIGARFVELDAGHFAMLVRAEPFDRLLRAFVAERLG